MLMKNRARDTRLMRERKGAGAVLLIIGSLCLVLGLAGAGAAEEGALRLTSPAFEEGGAIPTKYTCEGQDISPPLEWTGVPEDAESLVLVVDDPDAPDPEAPKMTWIHWVVYNIPPGIDGLAEGAAEGDFKRRAAHGLNSWVKAGYGGPCPPIGRHRYFFRLYALDQVLEGLDRPTKKHLMDVMEGHVIAEAELMGTYQKKK
jgi:hypothetical protein